MGTAQHYHVHLDVIVDGQAIPVTANIGVATQSGAMTGLHTHDTSGIIHVEAADANEQFTLGQLFTEWNVRLATGQLGGLTDIGDKTLSVYVDGSLVTKDPAGIVLRPHQQIAVMYGTTPTKAAIPSSFTFPPGV